MARMPDGETPPRCGDLPEGLSDTRPLMAYVHVPYCRVRCGYCDFNTYTASELGAGASRADYVSTLRREIALSAEVLARAGVGPRPFETVFFGGGTPTILPAADLVAALASLRSAFGVADGAEITTEANPDTLSPEYLAELRDGGFTRISLGMQSAVPHVLRTLDRTHDPERIPEVVAWVREAGLQVSLDLIYGTPGESADDWQASLDAALGLAPDHLSAYSLIVEEGTRMGAQVRRGELPMPSEDDLALKYEMLDEAASGYGYAWYEVSNFARRDDARCRHNLGYWRSDDWWGYGPGAHSHIDGVRFWNAKHPRAWSDRLSGGESPAIGREVLDAQTRALEDLMLSARVVGGFPLSRLSESAAGAVDDLIARGLLSEEVRRSGVLDLTLRGRLMADGIVRELSEHLPAV